MRQILESFLVGGFENGYYTQNTTMKRRVAALEGILRNDSLDIWYSNGGDVTHSIWECISEKAQSDIMIDVDRHLPEKNILGE